MSCIPVSAGEFVSYEEFLGAVNWTAVGNSAANMRLEVYTPSYDIYEHMGVYPIQSGSYTMQFKFEYSGIERIDNATSYTFRWFISREHSWAGVDSPPSSAYLTSDSGVTTVYSVDGVVTPADDDTYEYSLTINPNDIGGDSWSITILTAEVSGDALDTRILYSLGPVEFVAQSYEAGIVPPYDEPVYSSPGIPNADTVMNGENELINGSSDGFGQADAFNSSALDALATHAPAFMVVANVFDRLDDFDYIANLLYISLALGVGALLFSAYAFKRR